MLDGRQMVRAVPERFERELAKDRELLLLFEVATFGISLATVATLLVLIMPLHRTSPWLVLLSVYAIATRLAVLIARSALSVPQFLVHMDAKDARLAGAAREAFDRHRPAILPALVAGARSPADPRSLDAATHSQIAELARERGIERRRRIALSGLVAWCLVTVLAVSILVATGGGPRG